MRANTLECESTLLQRIEDSVRQTTYGRIRDLSVEEEEGRVVLRGQVPSRHTKQLALHAVLQLVSGDRFRECITVG